MQEPEVTETLGDPINRLADVLAKLQKEPPSMTVWPVTTTTMTFNEKSENFELFEDLFHTLFKMQLAMTEKWK